MGRRRSILYRAEIGSSGWKRDLQRFVFNGDVALKPATGILPEFPSTTGPGLVALGLLIPAEIAGVVFV